MEEKELKTKPWQRVAILLVAVIMLGSIIAGYVAIVASGSGNSGTSSSISDEKKAEYKADYDAKLAAFRDYTKDEYSVFSGQLGVVTTFDETAANEGEIKTKDLIEGDGRVLGEGDTNYLAYYIGWCADGKAFDSALDSTDNPTQFSRALDASAGLIEGWNKGVVGMKLGGVRRITIPGAQAYGDKMEICGGYNKPLRFLVMPVANEEPLKTMASELNTAYMRVQYAEFGVDYGA